MSTDPAYAGLQEAINVACERSPRVGKRVTIYHGKHRGKSGIVFWHGKNKHKRDHSSNWMQAGLREAIGTTGYRIGVQTDGGEKFFTSAEYAIEPCVACGVRDKSFCRCDATNQQDNK